MKFYNAAAFSRTPKPDPPEGLPHPVLFRGNDHRFPAATDHSYSATIHPAKSSPSRCADLTSTRKTSKGGEMPRFEEFQPCFLFCDWKPRGKGSWPLHIRKLRQFPNPKTKWGLVFLHWSWLKLVQFSYIQGPSCKSVSNCQFPAQSHPVVSKGSHPTCQNNGVNPPLQLEHKEPPTKKHKKQQPLITITTTLVNNHNQNHYPNKTQQKQHQQQHHQAHEQTTDKVQPHWTTFRVKHSLHVVEGSLPLSTNHNYTVWEPRSNCYTWDFAS